MPTTGKNTKDIRLENHNIYYHVDLYTVPTTMATAMLVDRSGWPVNYDS